MSSPPKNILCQVGLIEGNFTFLFLSFAKSWLNQTLAVFIFKLSCKFLVPLTTDLNQQKFKPLNTLLTKLSLLSLLESFIQFYNCIQFSFNHGKNCKLFLFKLNSFENTLDEFILSVFKKELHKKEQDVKVFSDNMGVIYVSILMRLCVCRAIQWPKFALSCLPMVNSNIW